MKHKRGRAAAIKGTGRAGAAVAFGGTSATGGAAPTRGPPLGRLGGVSLCPIGHPSGLLPSPQERRAEVLPPPGMVLRGEPRAGDESSQPGVPPVPLPRSRCHAEILSRGHLATGSRLKCRSSHSLPSAAVCSAAPGAPSPRCARRPPGASLTQHAPPSLHKDRAVVRTLTIPIGQTGPNPDPIGQTPPFLTLARTVCHLHLPHR